MKLLTYTIKDESKLGALWQDDQVVNLQSALLAYQNAHPNAAKLNYPNDMLSLIQNWDQSMPEVLTAFDWLTHSKDAVLQKEATHSLSQVEIEAPLSNPSKVVCVGLNYRDHCLDHHLPIPERPLLFSKFPSSITGPYGDVCWSKATSKNVDYEAELAIVIKKTCRNVRPEEALEYVAGYSVLNDISARDVQFADVQWVRGKSFDTFCPYGPYLVTADEVPDPQRLPIRLLLNDQVMQDSNTSQMIFPCDEIISYISQTSTLHPGDLIATGTPNGCGAAREPQVYLHDGDRLVVEIENIGRIENIMREVN